MILVDIKFISYECLDMRLDWDHRGGNALQVLHVDVPVLSEFGICKTVKAMLWTWL